MNQEIKKKSNYNIIYYILLITITSVLGFLLGHKINMLKVGATTFPNSNVTYNEQKFYKYEYINSNLPALNSQTYITITGNIANKMYLYMDIQGYQANKYLYTCTYSNSSLSCNIGYNVNSNTIYSNYLNTYTINTDTISDGTYNYSLVTTGYTEQQYLAYGQQQYTAGQNSVINSPNTYGLYTSAQYNANYTSGQNSVLNSPNTYNLYTTAQYTSYGTSQYNSGYSTGSTTKENDILTNPNNYGLYSSAQYTAYGTAQYNAGLQYVQNNPNLYNLYTTAQYTSYGTSQYNSGILAGQNDVINNPHNYNLYTSTEYADNYTAGQNAVINDPHSYDLYTTSEYNSYGTSQYNAGYLAGLNDNDAYNLGIQHVLDNPHDYNLYTQNEYNNYGTSRYNAGIQYVVDNPSTYDLYTTAQYDSYGEDEYNRGYEDGVNSYIYPDDPPTFNGVSGASYGCSATNDGCAINPSDIPDISDVIKPSLFLPYTTTLINQSGNYYIDTSNYIIDLMQSISANSTYVINKDINIKFCAGYNIFNYFGSTYFYCKSIATNIDNYIGTGNYLGLNDIYYNGGINVSAGSTINLSDYLVSGVNSYTSIQITLANNMTNTDYNDLTITMIADTVNDESYNLGYQNGYTTGNRIGLATGQKEQYTSGYNKGYQDATRVSDNSIRGLAETILTSPVNMFSRMFNVEFLDINLASFILSIFTIIVVIWLIKRLW